MPQPTTPVMAVRGAPSGARRGAGRRPDLDGRRRRGRRVGAARTPPREALSNRPVAAKALSDELSGLGGPIRNGAAVRFPGSGDVQVPAGLWLDTCSTANAVPGSGDGGRARSVPREASSEVGIALSRLLEQPRRDNLSRAVGHLCSFGAGAR